MEVVLWSLALLIVSGAFLVGWHNPECLFGIEAARLRADVKKARAEKAAREDYERRGGHPDWCTCPTCSRHV